MVKLSLISVFVLMLFSKGSFANPPSSQQEIISNKLMTLAQTLNTTSIQTSKTINALAQTYGWRTKFKTALGEAYQLKGVDKHGIPQYYRTFNATSAICTKAVSLYSGADLGLSLSASSSFMAGRVAVWDEAAIYYPHKEFASNRVEVRDGTLDYSSHSTHVGGTIAATGLDPTAKGMAYGLTKLYSYDWNNYASELANAAANGLLLSNHSYGTSAGWGFDGYSWYWYGVDGQSEDYKFGNYTEDTQMLDQICEEAPYLLPIQAAGNQHGAVGYAAYGPGVGEDYNVSINGLWMGRTRSLGTISSQDSYDNLIPEAAAKNVLTIGAIYGVDILSEGVVSSSITPFSSWGGTDDGRIKPDLVTRGYDVYSTVPDDKYAYSSGTSMATPATTGSLALLQEYYRTLYGNFMKAATLKSLAIHTADDIATKGPDYLSGWGSLNVEKAANVITQKGRAQALLNESTLKQGEIQELNFSHNGQNALRVTIGWTDPAASIGLSTPDDNTPKLINDLDIKIIDNTTKEEILPYKLDPSNPSNEATQGNNSLDNVEQIYIPSTGISTSYTVQISHKGTLKGGQQDYSIVATGMETTVLPMTEYGISIFPNPARLEINVAYKLPTINSAHIKLYSIAGQIIYESPTIQLSEAEGYQWFSLPYNYPSGVYYLSFVTGNETYKKTLILIR